MRTADFLAYLELVSVEYLLAAAGATDINHNSLRTVLRDGSKDHIPLQVRQSQST